MLIRRMPCARHQSASTAQHSPSQTPGNAAGGHHSATIATRPPVDKLWISVTGSRQSNVARTALVPPIRQMPWPPCSSSASSDSLRARISGTASGARRISHVSSASASALVPGRTQRCVADKSWGSDGLDMAGCETSLALSHGGWRVVMPNMHRAAPRQIREADRKLPEEENEKGVARDHPATPFYRIGCCYPTPGARLSSPRFRLQVTCENRICNVTNRCV